MFIIVGHCNKMPWTQTTNGECGDYFRIKFLFQRYCNAAMESLCFTAQEILISYCVSRQLVLAT